jgi:diadenosine tetraphosphatase ApaH/serine/threonine PP2A family protein phosphatase
MHSENPSALPDRTYAIGDIHGRSDLLDRLIVSIARDLKERPVAKALAVTLGDYIDRGPDSRGVLDRLIRNPFPCDYIPLKGNHEALLESFLSDPSVGQHWRGLGGLETLVSYRVPVRGLMIGKEYEQASKALRSAAPPEHLEFISSLRTSLPLGRYFLCHAGVRPGIPLDRQSVEDLLWIRGQFLQSSVDFGKIVVHGHTPSERPEVLPNRINVDTGAYITSCLTCAVLDAGPLRFLSTGG